MAAIAGTAILALVLAAGCGPEADRKQAAAFKAEDVNRQQIEAYNQFAVRMTKQLLQESGETNFVISPLSVTLALSLALNGASGETKQEMLRMLNVDRLPMEAINQGSEVLIDLLEHGDPAVDVKIANALWARKGTQLLDDYTGRMKQFYEAEISELDFDRKDAASTINKWVRKQTHNRIDSMADPEKLRSNVMVLMNAVYFNGRWTEPFKVSATRNAPFHLADGTDVTVPLMAQRASLPYKEGEGFKAVRLPYGSGRWGMIIVLPSEGVSLRDAEAALLADPAQLWRKDFESGDTIVELPRFKLDYKKKVSGILQSLGMKRAFDKQTADFSAMVSGSEGLYISSVTHKAFIEVDEQGTEAAAATSIEMDGGGEPSAAPFELRADRPFFFAIEDRTTGALMFLGSVSNPSS
ncbi:serpin family protein [Paenibacillus solisilvae]|uniref:Serpin family protein n=1 Tax=Paenibacillus solisilvae TaxID=2486751 RepID=A0ABW0VSB2_9BACL